MISLWTIVWPLAALSLALLLRIHTLIKHKESSKRRQPTSTCSLAVFLGSGGHTSEMRALLSSIPYDRYTPRIYIYCHGDDMSLKAVAAVESEAGTLTKDSYTLLALPRARKVGQSLPSTSLSSIRTTLIAFWHLFCLHPSKPFADVLLVNGPGTCVVLVMVCWIRRVLGLSYTRIIYVESFARVSSLSLSAKLIEPFVDRFIVQWANNKGEYKGWLV